MRGLVGAMDCSSPEHCKINDWIGGDKGQGLTADMDGTLDGMQHKAVKLPRVVTVEMGQTDCPDTENLSKAR